MKGDDLLELFGEVDARFVSAADTVPKKKTRVLPRYLLTAACLLLVVGVTLAAPLLSSSGNLSASKKDGAPSEESQSHWFVPCEDKSAWSRAEEASEKSPTREPGGAEEAPEKSPTSEPTTLSELLNAASRSSSAKDAGTAFLPSGLIVTPDGAAYSVSEKPGSAAKTSAAFSEAFLALLKENLDQPLTTDIPASSSRVATVILSGENIVFFLYDDGSVYMVWNESRHFTIRVSPSAIRELLENE